MKLRIIGKATAVFLTIATLISGVSLASASGIAPRGGGGGSSDGDGGGVLATHVTWAYKDANDGAFGGDSMDSINAAFAQMGVTMGVGGASAQHALDEAHNECVTRFNARHPEQRNNDQCRVTAVGVITGPSNEFSGMAHHLKTDWTDAWGAQVAGGTYSNRGTEYRTSSPFADDPANSVDSIVDAHTADSTSICVVMLDQFEPRPANYHLSVLTAQQGGFAQTGATNAVHDQVTASNNGSSIVENMNATSTMVWHSYPDGNAVTRAKNFMMGNASITQGPSFSPSDFGFAEWPAGRFGFSLDVPQQGHMDGAVHVGDDAPGENWTVRTAPPVKTLWKADDATQTDSASVVASGVPYVAHISAHTSGSGQTWLQDWIKTPDVWIGADDHDDLSKVFVTDGENGARLAAQVSIDRGSAGNVWVKAHVGDWMPRSVTMHVPTYPKATRSDMQIEDTSRVCWAGDGLDCQIGNGKVIKKVTPKPNKVWVVDANGALTTSDEGHTNHKGKDDRTFVPGDTIAAVVNGRIPAHLTGDLSAYAITDDWSGARRYVDFSDASKVKVYMGGRDRTGDFTITVSGSKTIAKAKAAALRGTKDLAADKPVKLVISGTVRDVDVPQSVAVTNSGSEQWGHEPVDTNVPSVFMRSPNPDKAWVLDTHGALATADPNRTNAVGKDKRVFVSGGAIGSVVNGRIPKGLAANLNKYIITDDWTGARRYVDFSDASKARVFIDGRDRTSDFTITVNGTKTVATAKAAILNGTENLSADRIVKLYIGGTVKDVAASAETRFTNLGSEQWNNKKSPSNTPSAFVRSPNPDKAWVLDTHGALATADSNHTNAVGKDKRVFVPGDAIGSVVNGSIPKGLAADLSKYVITDDWTGASRYVDFSDVSKARVYVDGHDRTGDFTIAVSGTKTVATAKAAVLHGTEDLAADKPVKLYIGGTMKDVTAPAETKFTNSGSEQWNNRKLPSNTPPAFVRSPNPDKAWVLDSNGALATADPNRTNAVGKDKRVFLPGDVIGSVVNGRIPKNLATDLSRYVITDDWSDASRYVDFSDASKVRVYVDGRDRTGDFTVTVNGTVTTATAKASVLQGTENLAADKAVKLYIGGTLKDVAAPTETKFTNSGFEQWNDKKILSNTPPAFVRTPNPDKAWVLDSNGALTTADPNRTNAVGKDKRVFIPGDAIGSVVNGRIPKGLAADLNKYVITDDWTGASRYVDFSDASKARVYVDGRDRTGDFTIAVSGTKTIATAKATVLHGTENLSADRKVKLYLGGTMKDVMAPTATKFTNSGSEQWNNKELPSNTPSAFVRTPDPDKAWVLDASGALHTEDPHKTNAVGEDEHVFLAGQRIGSVVNGKIPKSLAVDLHSYELTDDWADAATYIDFSDVSKARVFIDGRDRTADFAVTVSGTKTTARAKPAALRGTENLPADKPVKLYIEGTFKDGTRTGGRLVKMMNKASERWDGKKVQTNVPAVYVWTPNPDKSWVALENGDPLSGSKDYKLVIDPSKSNATGADRHSFRLGDRVGAAVNATVPARLGRVPELTLHDDYAAADRIVDPEALSHVRIYDKDVPSAQQSSVEAIDASGRDVTSRFDITRRGTRITATPKPMYAQSLKMMTSAKQITMLVPFLVNFDPSHLRREYGKAEGNQLDTCINPGGSGGLTNLGGESAGTADVSTNRPGICVTVPAIHKDVLSEGSQGGRQESVDGKSVFPGQKLEYQVKADPQIPASDMYEVTRVEVTDTYDPHTTADKQTLEIRDLDSGANVPHRQWTVRWDGPNHTFTVAFDRSWVDTHWGKGSHPRILLRFEAKVDADAPTDHTVDNQAALTVNNGAVPSNKVHNPQPPIEPSKTVTQAGTGVDVDGRTFLKGDKGEYHLVLDASHLTGTAYRIQRLGMVDDYEEDYLKVDGAHVKVTDRASGADVTGGFNIQAAGGVAYVFAKTVDTPVDVTGETIPGNPQPKDLKAYSTKVLDPLHDPYVNQGLAGRTFEVTLPFTVTSSKAHTVVNKATQVTNDRRETTNTVSNPIAPLDPKKDVVVHIGGASRDKGAIYNGQTFDYRLDSSVLPVHRAYQKVTGWKITDPIDTDHDRYTGQWMAVARRDVHWRDGGILARKGQMIGGRDFDSGRLIGPLFEETHTAAGVVTVSATDHFLNLISADDIHEQAFTIYLQCVRIKPADKVENTFTETLNGADHPSNTVWTRTPDLAAALDVQKWDAKSGWPKGDRDSSKDALELGESEGSSADGGEGKDGAGGDSDSKKGVDIVFTIRNVSKSDPETGYGPVFRAKDLKLEDTTIAGDGTVTDLKYPKGWSELVLKPGQSVDVHGMLHGVTKPHTDRVRVTGIPYGPCLEESDDEAEAEAESEGGATSQVGPGGGGQTRDEAGTQGKGTEGDGVSGEPIEVDGAVMCPAGSVTSNRDDWNAKPRPQSKPALPPVLVVSGTSVSRIEAMAVIGLVIGVALMAGRMVGGRARHRRH